MITVDGDKEAMGTTIVAYRGEEWLAEITVHGIESLEDLQELVDMVTHRKPALSRKR